MRVGGPYKTSKLLDFLSFCFFRPEKGYCILLKKLAINLYANSARITRNIGKAMGKGNSFEVTIGNNSGFSLFLKKRVLTGEPAVHSHLGRGWLAGFAP